MESIVYSLLTEFSGCSVLVLGILPLQLICRLLLCHVLLPLWDWRRLFCREPFRLVTSGCPVSWCGTLVAAEPEFQLWPTPRWSTNLLAGGRLQLQLDAASVAFDCDLALTVSER